MADTAWARAGYALAAASLCNASVSALKPSELTALQRRRQRSNRKNSPTTRRHLLNINAGHMIHTVVGRQ